MVADRLLRNKLVRTAARSQSDQSSFAASSFSSSSSSSSSTPSSHLFFTTLYLGTLSTSEWPVCRTVPSSFLVVLVLNLCFFLFLRRTTASDGVLGCRLLAFYVLYVRLRKLFLDSTFGLVSPCRIESSSTLDLQHRVDSTTFFFTPTYTLEEELTFKLAVVLDTIQQHPLDTPILERNEELLVGLWLPIC